MGFTTPLVYNISTGNLVFSVQTPTPVAFPTWFLEDSKNLTIQFVQSGATQGTVSVAPGTGIGLQVAIGTPGIAAVSSATAGASVGDVFSVVLPMNTTALQALFAGPPATSQVTLIFEFRTSSGGTPQRYQFPLIVKLNLIPDTLIDPAPPDTAIGKADANASFVLKNGGNGDIQIMRSKDGTKRAQVYLGNDGILHTDLF